MLKINIARWLAARVGGVAGLDDSAMPRVMMEHWMGIRKMLITIRRYITPSRSR
jgi:hypothetical protein